MNSVMGGVDEGSGVVSEVIASWLFVGELMSVSTSDDRR